MSKHFLSCNKRCGSTLTSHWTCSIISSTHDQAVQQLKLEENIINKKNSLSPRKLHTNTPFQIVTMNEYY